MKNKEFVKLIVDGLSWYEVECLTGDQWSVALKLVMSEKEGRALLDLLTEKPKTS